MSVEIERKFLIKDDSWKSQVKQSSTIQQGYLNSNKERTVRIRTYGEQGFLTIKGKNENYTRKEFEYKIPFNEALDLLLLCEQPIIEKIRYIVVVNNNSWEIDVFAGDNAGLIIAEIELESELQQFKIPNWIGEEVSSDPKYFNSSLIKYPYLKW